jgi:putative oxidoreductase
MKMKAIISAAMAGIVRLLGSPLLSAILRGILGALFVAASWDKIVHPARFVEDVANYGLLPPLLVNLFALVLPWVEMIAGLFLILGFFSRSSSLTLVLLLVSFIIAISIILIRGYQIPCGCFGPDEELGLKTLLRDLGMLAMGLQIFFCEQGLYALDSLLRRKRGRASSRS